MLAVPRRLAGIGLVDGAVVASWESLAGGHKMLAVEPSIETFDVNELGEPLLDAYGTPWGQVLKGVDLDVLTVSGTATVRMPAGIPDVE